MNDPTINDQTAQRLVRIGAITPAQAKIVADRQGAGDPRSFGEIAIELGYINDEALQSYLDIRITCRHHQRCHFYNIPDMVGSNLTLKELYCERAPKRCAIYQARATGKPVPITLWPTGKLIATKS